MTDRRSFWLWFVGTLIGAALAGVVLCAVLDVAPEKGLLYSAGFALGVCVGAAGLYFWRVRGRSGDPDSP